MPQASPGVDPSTLSAPASNSLHLSLIASVVGFVAGNEYCFFCESLLFLSSLNFVLPSVWSLESSDLTTFSSFLLELLDELESLEVLLGADQPKKIKTHVLVSLYIFHKIIYSLIVETIITHSI